MKTDEIINILTSIKSELHREYKANIKGIFGSYVRGKERIESDIDILVEFEKGADLVHFVGLSHFLEEKLGIAVDVVPYDTIRDELKSNILEEAVYI